MLKACAIVLLVCLALSIGNFAEEQQQTSTAPSTNSDSGKPQSNQVRPAPSQNCPQPPGMLVDCASSVTLETVAPQPLPEIKPLIDPKEPSVLGVLDIITVNSKVYENIRNLRV